MIPNMATINKQKKKDIRLIAKFVEVYCAGKHGNAERHAHHVPAGSGIRQLCHHCADFMDYAVARRLNCPLEAEKPTCKRCRIHCYAKAQREQVREIMAYSGRRLIMRGRLDYLWHYLF